ncbi:MAG TPA: hemin-degrading factor [Morganella sp. (in: Bacteria)]|nr:hemin-degrading factor [Morganella sp. (in: enterobacteria)]
MHSEQLTRYLALKEQGTVIHARDIAALMGLSEAELAHCRTGFDTHRLTPDIPAILPALAAAGELKGLTRNNYAVHEHLGTYEDVQFGEHACLLLKPYGLDLRFFLSQWKTVFAFEEKTAHGLRHSIQFFDSHGDSVHKIYTTSSTNMNVWHQVTEQFLAADNPPLSPEPLPVSIHPALTSEQQAEFTRAWQKMTDVHQFFILLKKFNINRLQAFRYVGNPLAQRVDNNALSRILTLCTAQQNDIMVFVANRGCVQIFTGAVARTEPYLSPQNEQRWLNIFNPEFTLHLVESAIAESWITRKPTKDGVVTSLELFDANGQQIAQLFGQRTEGEPEQDVWRTQINALPAELSDTPDDEAAA